MTARTKLEQAFHESEELFHALMDNVVDGLIIIDEAGIVQAFNRAAEEMFAYSATEIVGQNVSKLMPEPDRSAHDGYIDAYRKTGQAKIIGIGREVVGRRKDGTEFPMDLSIGEIPHHEAPFFIGVVRDLTERKLREEVTRQAYKMEALGQLTGGVAHDFNNLLAVLMMDLELLDDLAGDREKEQELITEAREVARSGADLTRRLLVFARNQALSPRSIDVGRLIQDLAAILHRTLGDDIEIDTVIPPHLWPAFGDLRELENALLNLALNARDAMPAGGQLTIATDNTTVDDRLAVGPPGLSRGDYVQISVSDTGHGMTHEVRTRAFDPFFSTKDKEHGTGLGLSMVFGFVRQSGGHVEIDSEEGVGTTINLLLPRDPVIDRETGPATESSDGLDGGAETILLVEDHEQLRARGVQTLTGLGYSVIAAANARDALAVLGGDDRIDLLFTDVVMPGGMTGPELVEQAQSLRTDLRVVYTTGYAEHSQLKSDQTAESPSILHKPYSRRQLAQTIRGALDGPAQ